MKRIERILLKPAIAGLAGLLMATGSAAAQPGEQADRAPAYVRLETQSNTYTWLAAAAMLGAVMVIAFKKPKRVATH